MSDPLRNPLHPFHPRYRYFVPRGEVDLWAYRAPRRLTQAELQAIVDGLARFAEERTYTEAEILAEFGGEK